MNDYQRKLYDDDMSQLSYPLLLTPDFSKYLTFNHGTKQFSIADSITGSSIYEIPSHAMEY